MIDCANLAALSLVYAVTEHKYCIK